MRNNRRQLLQYDLVTFFATIALIVMGILFIYSSGHSLDGANNSNEYIRQIIWACSGIVLLIVFSFTNYRFLKEYALYFYILSAVLLLVTILFGKEVNGAKSWLGIGSLGIQSSEFAKLATILYVGLLLDKNNIAPYSVRTLFKVLLSILLPIGLILLQPDLGTALVFIPIALVMCFVSGIRIRYLLFIVCVGLLLIFFIIFPTWVEVAAEFNNTQPNTIFGSRIFFWSIVISAGLILLFSLYGYQKTQKHSFYWITYGAIIVLVSLPLSILARQTLQEYQIARLMIFIDPTLDPQGAGWNVIQSVTAIGSGGLFGTGFLQGSQSQYNFLPQQSTDFIFSVLSEEWGFLGGFIVFLLFIVIIFRGIGILSHTKDKYAVNIGSGIITLILFHFTINVGMTMGIMPITGIPLVLLSHGGSALWVAMIAIGILISLNQYTSQN